MTNITEMPMPASNGVHINEITPGKRVLDHLRCRKTILEILSAPIEETVPAVASSCLGVAAADIVSSWVVWVKDLRQGRIFSTRIDCNEAGDISRFSLCC
ncbi:MAG: hypothetical protein AAGI66_02510 [Cyanobacteria bacterium P01_H01_bin.74]